jgi:predicted  nucleic acid-binding Zn-ribbon protein
MTVEVAVLISGVSVAFGIYAGVANLKRNQKSDDKKDAAEMTTVIVKLENIGNGIAEIKSEMTNVKNDIKEDRERIIRVEESAKQAHKRLDSIEKYKRPGDSDE